MVVVIDSSVPGRVAHLLPAWRKCMTMTIRPTRTTDSLVCQRLTPLVTYSTYFPFEGLRDCDHGVALREPVAGGSSLCMLPGPCGGLAVGSAVHARRGTPRRTPDAAHSRGPQGAWPTLAAAPPALGRGPHIGWCAPAALRDKTVACAASAQRTPDTRPRHSAGRPPAWQCGGGASRPRPAGPETGSRGDPWPPHPPAGGGSPGDGRSGRYAE